MFNFYFNLEQRDFWDYVDIFMPIVVGILALIIAIIANNLTKISIKTQMVQFKKQLNIQKQQFSEQMKNQYKQWKYDIVIKQEIEALIKMKNLFYDAQSSIHWFLWNFIAPFEGYTHYFHNAFDEAFRKEAFIHHWKKLQLINNCLSENLIIFQKYKLASKIQFVQPILSLTSYFSNKDFEIEFDTENTNGISESSDMKPQCFYKLKNINKYKYEFAKEANERLIKLKIVDYNNINNEELLSNYNYIWGKVMNIINNIENDINEIIFNYDDFEIAENEKIGIHKYYISNNWEGSS